MLSRSRLIPLIAVIGAIILSLFIFPTTVALHYQIRGGRLIENVLNNLMEDPDSAPVACSNTSGINEAERHQLEEAISALKTAKQYNPSAAYTYLQLGRAYCLLRNLDNAIDAYKDFTRLRPNNPLGHLELGFAYIRYHRSDLALEEFRNAWIEPNQLLEEGNNAFTNGQFEYALQWYDLTRMYKNALPKTERFRWCISQIIISNLSDKSKDNCNLSIYEITDEVQIEAENLQSELFGGEILSEKPGDNPEIGVLWWNDVAIALVSLPQAGDYEIRILAKNTPPAPVKFSIEHNYDSLANFDLEKEDMSWQEFEVNTFLKQGLHIIGVRFLNDGEVNNLDRNLFIDWVKLQQR